MPELRIHGFSLEEGKGLQRMSPPEYLTAHIVRVGDDVTIEWYDAIGDCLHREAVADGARRILTFEVQ